MGDIEALDTAIQALFPATVNARFTRVPPGTRPPWTRVSIVLPSPQTRAMTTRVLTYRATIRTVIAGANTAAVWQIASLLLAALEGARVECEGWRCSPIQQLNGDPRPYEDTTVTLTETNTHPVILPLDFDFHLNHKETL